jgi:hypothetical protein
VVGSTRGRLVSALVALAVAVGVAGGLVWWTGRDATEPGPPRSEPSLAPAAALANAASACVALAEFENLLDANAPAKRAREVLARAVRDAKAAAEADPRWVVLASGAQTLDLAIRTDDANAADVGITVVRQECERTGATPAP